MDTVDDVQYPELCAVYAAGDVSGGTVDESRGSDGAGVGSILSGSGADQCAGIRACGVRVAVVRGNDNTVTVVVRWVVDAVRFDCVWRCPDTVFVE